MSDAKDDSPGASAPPKGEPRTSKKKKKRRKASRAQPAQPLLDEYGRERPRFVLTFPSDPELDALVSAFQRGNYAHVRREAPLLAARTADEAVREAALELRRRLDPDPLLGYLLGVAVALLAFLTAYFYATKAP
jgi:hypothetical protein